MDAAKAFLKEKIMTINTYIIEEENFQINDLSFHLMKPEKQYMKPSVSRTKKKIEPKVETSEKENRKTT